MHAGGVGYRLLLWHTLWNVAGASGPTQTHFFCMGEGARHRRSPRADSGASLVACGAVSVVSMSSDYILILHCYNRCIYFRIRWYPAAYYAL